VGEGRLLATAAFVIDGEGRVACVGHRGDSAIAEGVAAMSAARLRRYLRNGMMPQLAVFEASVRLGSFTLAADELHLAQPTVSTQIRKLTEAVGQPLFEHVGRRMRVTPAGQALYAACQEILRTLGRVDEALVELKGLRAGRLRLAVGTAAECLAVQLLGGFAGRHPDVEVTLRVRNQAGLAAALAANEDDLYVFANPPPALELVRQSILPNALVPVARTDHPLARERSIPFARFAQEPFLIREPGSATRAIGSDLFAGHRLEPHVRMELSSNEAIVQAILAGLGVSILPLHSYGLAKGRSNLAALDVEGFPIDRPWQFVYPVGKQLCPVARAFMDFVRAEAHLLIEMPCASGEPPRPPGRPSKVARADGSMRLRQTA
jgi:LysR family transcriptional regulator, low CO2-responsive transcriptional regulator